MEYKSASKTPGVDGVLDPVIERLERQIEVELRLAREDFERQMHELHRRQQGLFLLAFAAFAICAIVLAASTYWAVSSLSERAQASLEESSGAGRRLDRLEEDVRGRLETLETLERRLRIGILESPPAPPAPVPVPSGAAPGSPPATVPPPGSVPPP